MGSELENAASAVMALPASARAYLAEKLIESLEEEQDTVLSTGWIEEIRRRCRDIDLGLVNLRSAEAVFADAYSVFK